MLKFYTKAKALLATRDQGVTAAEYGLILAGIAVAIMVIVFTLGTQIAAMFTSVSEQMATVGGGGGE